MKTPHSLEQGNANETDTGTLQDLRVTSSAFCAWRRHAGHYPAGGITLEPAMTFGTVAVRHLAGAETELSALAGSSPRGPGRLTTMQTTIFVPAMLSRCTERRESPSG
jgi:hypothetical protein